MAEQSPNDDDYSHGGKQNCPDYPLKENVEGEDIDVSDFKQLYERLIEITQNEIELLDDLLPYQALIVDAILNKIDHMNDILNECRPSYPQFVIEQHELSLERINYLINTYLRTRLRKLDHRASKYIKLLQMNYVRATKFLSPFEAKYLDRDTDSIDTYIKEIMADFPPIMRQFYLANIPDENKRKYAFVIGRSYGRIIDGEHEIEIEPDVCRILTTDAIIESAEKGSRCFKLI